MQRKWPSDRVCFRFPQCLRLGDQRLRGLAAAREGDCGVGWERGLGSGSGNLLSLLSSSQFSAAPPAPPLFPLWDHGGYPGERGRGES